MKSQAKRLLTSVEQLQGIDKLLAVMRALRDPMGGCDWDRKQTYQSIAPYTIEEVYEVVDAIENSDFDHLGEELGDLLFQVVFYAQLAEEENRFDFTQIAQAVSDKLIKRHPHVFANAEIGSDQALTQAWEAGKQAERQRKNINASLLDDIPKVLPELKKAQKMQKRAAKGGFDWDDVSQVWDKLAEESAEVKQAVAQQDSAAIEDEIGDLLFTVVNLARSYRVDADSALRKANRKFERRFRQVERSVDKPLTEYNLQQLEALWQSAKDKIG